MSGRNRLLLVVGLVLTGLPLPGQGQAAAAAAAAAPPQFMVTTLKPAASVRQGRGYIRMENFAQFAAKNQTLKELIAAAYNLTPQEISGEPAWADSGRYDIVAETFGDPWPTLETQMQMLQTILANRFKLTFHREQKEMPVYALTVATGGPKLRPEGTISPDQQTIGPPLFVGIVVSPGSLRLRGRRATMAELVSVFERPAFDQPVGTLDRPPSALDRPVLDKTGLSKRYDFDMEFTPDASQFGGAFREMSSTLIPRPELFSAIQQQLGLKLEPATGPVETLVVDRAELPPKI